MISYDGNREAMYSCTAHSEMQENLELIQAGHNFHEDEMENLFHI